jgi:hypothetical protein
MGLFAIFIVAKITTLKFGGASAFSKVKASNLDSNIEVGVNKSIINF